MTNEEVFSKLKDILVKDFDIEESLVKPEALIVDDLDLDSIDAVEMIVKIKPFINGKIEPEDFKAIKTVEDVVKLIQPMTK